MFKQTKRFIIKNLFDCIAEKSNFQIIANNVEDKRLVKELITILKEHGHIYDPKRHIKLYIIGSLSLNEISVIINDSGMVSWKEYVINFDENISRIKEVTTS